MNAEILLDPSAFAETDRISDVEIDDGALPPPSADMEQERRIAVFDLKEEGRVKPAAEGAAPGPYAIAVTADDSGLALRLVGADGAAAAEAKAARAALGELAAEYAALCESYRDAVRSMTSSQISRIDQERRALHAESAEALAALMADAVRMDAATARRLFTLAAALLSET